MSTTPSATPEASRRFRLSLGLFSLDLFSLDTWAVIAATALVLAIVVGTLPRVPW